MTEHVHEWYGDDQGAVCGVDSCEETLSQKETNRRLNATERLSPHLLGSLAYDRKLEKHWRKAFAEYAQALDGGDDHIPDELAAAGGEHAD